MSNEADEKNRSITLSRIAEIVKICPKFFDFDWCNVNCDLFSFCDQIYDSQDASKINGGKKPTIESIKETIESIRKKLSAEDGEL